MARAGIYANGKKIVARYFGNKLVWEKTKWVLFRTIKNANWIESISGNFFAYTNTKTTSKYDTPSYQRLSNSEPVKIVIDGKEYIDLTASVDVQSDDYTDTTTIVITDNNRRYKNLLPYNHNGIVQIFKKG